MHFFLVIPQKSSLLPLPIGEGEHQSDPAPSSDQAHVLTRTRRSIHETTLRGGDAAEERRGDG
jgi:hypothetical protein